MRKSIKLEGKTYRVFSINFFDETVNVIVKPCRYRNNNSLALTVEEICEDGESDDYTEPFGTLSSNLPQITADVSDRYALKTYSENEGWAEQLAMQLGKPTGRMFSSGYAVFPEYTFDEEKVYAEEE